MDWLSQNWIWIFVVGAMFLMMRRGGMGCGMNHAHGPADKAAAADAKAPEGKEQHRHHGCC